MRSQKEFNVWVVITDCNCKEVPINPLIKSRTHYYKSRKPLIRNNTRYIASPRELADMARDATNFDRNLSLFQSNILPLSSGSKSNPNKQTSRNKPQAKLYKQPCRFLVWFSVLPWRFWQYVVRNISKLLSFFTVSCQRIMHFIADVN
jgi:hypothetical protein